MSKSAFAPRLEMPPVVELLLDDVPELDVLGVVEVVPVVDVDVPVVPVPVVPVVLVLVVPVKVDVGIVDVVVVEATRSNAALAGA